MNQGCLPIGLLVSILAYLLDTLTGIKTHTQQQAICIVVLRVAEVIVVGRATTKHNVDALPSGNSIEQDLNNAARCCGWIHSWQGAVLMVEQDTVIEDIALTNLEDTFVKDMLARAPALHTEYGRAFGRPNLNQSRTQCHVAYRFSRAAPSAATPVIEGLTPQQHGANRERTASAIATVSIKQLCVHAGSPRCLTQACSPFLSRRNISCVAGTRNGHSTSSHGNRIDYDPKRQLDPPR